MTSRARMTVGIAALAGLLVGVWLLSPILTPFVFAAGLAYLGDPLVDRLEGMRIPRAAGVAMVFASLTLVAVILGLLLVPMLQDQVVTVSRRVPDLLDAIQNRWLPAVGISLPEGFRLDISGLRQFATEHWSQAGGLAAGLWGSLSKSGGAVVAVVGNLALIPVVTFYLLRDWDRLIARIAELIPRRWMPTVRELALETDDVLSAFIRGQLLVMVCLALVYVIGLWIVGLDLALLIGLIAGLVSFVPYLGFIVGVLLAVLASLIESAEWLPLVGVAVVFGFGQLLESTVLTPLLVGDRIGLHPVAVIFAVLAGGQLFGFVGVLLALPAAAAIAVLVRFATRQWLASGVYRGDT